MREIAKTGLMMASHAENNDLITYNIAKMRAEGHTKPLDHCKSRPPITEYSTVAKLIMFAKETGCTLELAHMSTVESMELARKARFEGQKVFVETCPHYLLLDDSRYSLPDFAGARYVCAPPLRKKLDNERLWKALADGEIQTVSTDHCSFTLAQKDAGRGDFTKIPGGMPGVETRGTLLFTYGVAAGRITAERMADVLAETPAKLYGLFPRKGVLQPGADADIVVYDPRGTSCITAADQAANVDYAPYEGTQIAGHIAEVYLRGTCVVREGKILHDRNGQYLHRGKCML